MTPKDASLSILLGLQLRSTANVPPFGSLGSEPKYQGNHVCFPKQNIASKSPFFPVLSGDGLEREIQTRI